MENVEIFSVSRQVATSTSSGPRPGRSGGTTPAWTTAAPRSSSTPATAPGQTLIGRHQYRYWLLIGQYLCFAHDETLKGCLDVMVGWWVVGGDQLSLLALQYHNLAFLKSNNVLILMP